MKRVFFRKLDISPGDTREEVIEFGQPGVLESLHLSLPEDTSLWLFLHGRRLPEDSDFEGPLTLSLQRLGLKILESPFSLRLVGQNDGTADATIRLTLLFDTDP